MNKALLLLFFVWTSTGALLAQSFTIEPIPAYGSADLQDDSTSPADFVAHAKVTNTTNAILNLSWIRTEKVMPDGWKTGVCDLNYCYGPEVGRRDFQLQPNASGILDVHAYPGGIPGSLENGAIPGDAIVDVLVTNNDNVEDTITGVFIFNLVGNPILSVSQPELDKLTVYPNPTTEYFELSSTLDNEINTVEIHNILGSKVRLFQATERRFEVADLPNGIYLISLLDEKESILKTLRLQKR